MVEEEGLEQQGFTIKTYPWYEEDEISTVKILMGDGPMGSNAPLSGAVTLADEITRLRYSFTPEEVERYRRLGERASRALERTLLDTRKGEKESEDTILATSKGPELITYPIYYSTLSMSVEGIPFVRPAILEKHG